MKDKPIVGAAEVIRGLVLIEDKSRRNILFSLIFSKIRSSICPNRRLSEHLFPTAPCQSTKLNPPLNICTYFLAPVLFLIYCFLKFLTVRDAHCIIALFAILPLVCIVDKKGLFSLVILILFHAYVPNAWWQITSLSRLPIRLLAFAKPIFQGKRVFLKA